ncbi:MAG TPA: AAA family ATPase, partial [Flavobacteriales bacterium]|nr:AAA family ATPase [Flavobacteriales bacterium]
MTKNPFPNSLSERSQRISGLHERLGTTHFGIDTEIQQVLDAFVPWYQFAETQDRPRTIGLWGMTGTGKSSLVRELVKEAGLEERTFWLDAGECRDKYWLDKFFDQLEEDLDGQPFIVVVDEFQHARTIDQGARELS